MISFIGLVEALLATGLCFCIVRSTILFDEVRKQNVVEKEVVSE